MEMENKWNSAKEKGKIRIFSRKKAVSNLIITFFGRYFSKAFKNIFFFINNTKYDIDIFFSIFNSKKINEISYLLLFCLATSTTQPCTVCRTHNKQTNSHNFMAQIFAQPVSQILLLIIHTSNCSFTWSQQLTRISLSKDMFYITFLLLICNWGRA